MRVYHRYLGFFLAGIMSVYAISGIILIFRDTDFLKKEVLKDRLLDTYLSAEQLGKEIKIKGLHFTIENGNLATFDQGTYNRKSGLVTYTTKDLPFLLERRSKLHIA